MQGVLAKLATPEEAAIEGAVRRDGRCRHIERTRAAGYAGPLIMGDDRMVIEVGEAVRVVPTPLLKDLPDLDSKTAEF